MPTIKSVITSQGLSSVTADGATGVRYEFSRVEFGGAQYDPVDSQTALKKKLGEVTVADSKGFERTEANGTKIYGTNVTAVISGDAGFDIGEVGVYVKAQGKEVLFSVASSASSLISRKLPGEEILISIDIFMSKDLKEIMVTGTGARLNLDLDDELSAIASDILAIRGAAALSDRKVASLENRITLLENAVKNLVRRP